MHLTVILFEKESMILFDSQTSFLILLKKEINFCFPIACLVLSLTLNFKIDEHPYEVARTWSD